jgi:hypothetical protein
MQTAAQECRRTLAIISKNYFESMFTQSEWAAAFVSDPTGASRRLIPVRVDHCRPPGILAAVIYCDLVDVDEKIAAQRLLKAVREETIRPGPSAAPFPGRAGNGLPAVAVSAAAAADEKTVVTDILDLLDMTGTTFLAQARVRNELVARMRGRLKPREHLQYERFFQRYFSEMDAEERAIHGTIRAYTENVLSSYNQSVLDLLKANPALVRQIKLLPELKQHLEVWLAKFRGVFHQQPAMCLVYVGVEEKVPFPSGVEKHLAAHLEKRRRLRRD